MGLKVHSYESLGTYDGPGIRLVVFLQGCPFRCLYCANPDTISFQGGTETEGEEILRRALNEKPFFGRRGGVTFSGGEPTSQARELVPVIRQLQANGINVCIDTNGGMWNSDVEELFGLADLTLLDIKEFDNTRHREITGMNNTQTLGTALWLEEHQRPFWMRYVLVPGLSDSEKDIRALGEHFKDYRMLRKVEILPYHTLGKHKYETLGWKYQLEDTPLNTSEQLARAKALFEEYFTCVTVN